MLQIVSISQARSNLSKLIRKLRNTKKPIVIVQGSTPAAILYPYEQVNKYEEQKEYMFEKEFQNLLKEGEGLWKSFTAKKKIKKDLTEEEAYSLIKHA